ncbi:flagellar hook capping FlgD N-terminal domain-containing protein [Paraherbaspirillum soli]|uniref:Basal-body rod modification protein FlgD n=1 Tax=Paraherbaspirillum soli TaxID=631222 RepID=A0ABW0MBF6_9BURK
MALGAINPAGNTTTRPDSLGLDMQSLLKIVLTQLTYQDPLKPVENTEFVSQLAQFASLEQTRQMSDRVDSLLTVQGSTQAIGMLGKNVDVAAQGGTVTGVVQSIAFKNGQPTATIKTADGQFLPDISLSQISQVR